MNHQANKEKQYRKGIDFDPLFPVPLSMDEGVKRRDELETAIGLIELNMQEHGRENSGWHRQAGKALWIKREQLKLINRWLIEQGGFLRNLYEYIERWAGKHKPDTPVVQSVEIRFNLIHLCLYDPTGEKEPETLALDWQRFQSIVLRDQPIFN